MSVVPIVINTTDAHFDPRLIIETHLVTPTIVKTDGLIGNFDTLRVALEHIRTHGPDRTLLSIQAPGEELQFSQGALLALLEGFTVWLHEAGLLNSEDAPGRR